MKKKFSAVLSLLLALVMCFALIACDSGDPDDGPSKPPVVSSAVAKLRSADGYKGAVMFKAETGKHKAAVDFDGAFEKRGNMIKATAGEGETAEDYVFDAATGYLYTNTANGYYFESLLPQGIVDYAEYMLETLLVELSKKSGEKSVDDLFVYDGDTRTSTFKYDGATTANAYLAPVISAYKNKSNFITLINNYLKLVSPDPTRPYTFEAVMDMLITFVATQPDAPLGTLIQAAEGYGIDVYGLLEKSGLLERYNITLDAATKEKIEARKVAEFVTALDEVLNTVKDDPTIIENIPALLDKLFVAEVTVTDFRGSLNSIKNLITAFLTVQEVKPVIDKYLGGGMSPAYMRELYAVIVNGVEIDKLDITVSLKFDGNDDIIGITANGNFAHNYKGDATGFTVLSDNNYKFDLKLDIDEYLTVPPAFELDFADDAALASKVTVTALVHGALDGDVKVYLETGGKNVTVAVSPDVTFMTYDAATHTFKFDIQAVKTAYADQIQAGTFESFGGVALADGGNKTIVVAVKIMPETPQGLLKVLGEMSNKIPNAPESGEVTVQPSN